MKLRATCLLACVLVLAGCAGTTTKFDPAKSSASQTRIEDKPKSKTRVTTRIVVTPRGGTNEPEANAASDR